MRGRMGAGSLALMMLAAPARAECLGSCADSLMGALVAMLVYGVLALVVLVMLIRAKWRRGGVRLALSVVLIAVGVPLVSQGWAAFRLNQMEGREIVGTVPDLTGRTPLLLSDSISACYYDACALALHRAGAAGTLALPLDALDGMDLTKPIPLANLPLERWTRPDPNSSTPTSVPLTATERQQAAGQIDYLILTRKSWYGDDRGPVETALSRRPGLETLRDSKRVHFALGPITGGALDFAGMAYDLLDLWLADRPLALILAPYNRQDPGNTIANRPAVLALLCPDTKELDGWNCDYALP